MKKKKTLPKSIRKYIRKEKAAIRRKILNWKDRESQIQELIKKFHKE